MYLISLLLGLPVECPSHKLPILFFSMLFFQRTVANCQQRMRCGSELTTSYVFRSDNPVEGITLQDPIYSIVEERAVYGKGNIYDDDPHDMGAYETDQYGSHNIYSSPQELYDNLGIY